ncbi:MAG: hypothetical protein IKC35_00455 [Clostridia bacterium]|nr:hypothetical protein [Clostridia bacterium]
MNDKIATLIGFAVKANKLIYGLDTLEEGNKKRYLIVCCHTLSERAFSTAKFIAKRDGVPILVTKTRKLEDIVYKRNCKVIGISNKQMSDAIIDYITNDYSLIKSEEI